MTVEAVFVTSLKAHLNLFLKMNGSIEKRHGVDRHFKESLKRHIFARN